MHARSLSTATAALTALLATGCGNASASLVPHLASSSIHQTKPSAAFVDELYVWQGEASSALRALPGVRQAAVYTKGHVAYVALDQSPHTILEERGRIAKESPTTGSRITVLNPLLLQPEIQPGGANSWVREHAAGVHTVSRPLYEAITHDIQGRIAHIEAVYVVADPTVLHQFLSAERSHQAGHPLDRNLLDDAIRHTWPGAHVSSSEPYINQSQMGRGHR